MAKKPRNELEILTQIETYRQAIERSRASVLKPNDVPTLGQLQQAHDDQMKWEAMIETLNWVLAQSESVPLTEGDRVKLRVLAEHDRLVALMHSMRETADKLEIVTQKMSSTAFYKRLRAAEDKRNGRPKQST